jgi:hypothetical protein
LLRVGRATGPRLRPRFGNPGQADLGQLVLCQEITQHFDLVLEKVDP